MNITSIPFDILPQPDLTSCGPTCLHAVYRYYGLEVSLDQVIKETPTLEGGGTMGVLLGNAALKRGFKVTIYTYNLSIFDPTWFLLSPKAIDEKLALQTKAKSNYKKLVYATKAYRNFLALGGNIRLEDLTVDLIRRHLKRGIPILTGLSSTYLYRSSREVQSSMENDDVLGTPSGHFVVLHGYDRENRVTQVADPDCHAPIPDKHYYDVKIERIVGAVLLGIITFDANLVIIEPENND